MAGSTWMRRPLRLPLGDVDGGEFTALDLVQHGLAGDAECFGCLIEGEPSVGGVGHDLVAELGGDPQSPGSTDGELFTGDEPGVEPAMDGALVDAEDLLGLVDRDHVVIIVGGCDIGSEHVDAVRVAQAADPAACERQAGAGGSPVVRRCLARMVAMVVSS